MRYSFLTALAAIVVTSGAALAADLPHAKAPDTYKVQLDLSTGPVVIQVERSAAPLGADRFFNLVNAKYYDGARFFRVIPGFMAQVGAAADPAVNKKWSVPIQDDPVRHSNARGTVTFAATSRPNSRTTQIFINFGDNARLDGMGFAPFARVISGMENVDKITAEYGEHPDQTEIEAKGNAYLTKEFPRLDYIKTARIIP